MSELTVEPIIGEDGASVAGLTVSGELDHDNAEDFLEAFRSALPTLQSADGRVMVDCGQVRSCDYAGLSALLMARREAADLGATLTLTRQSTPLAALLSIAGVSDLLSPEDEAPGETSQSLQSPMAAMAGGRGSLGPDARSDQDEVAVGWVGAVPVVTLAGQVDLDSVEDITAAFATARRGAADARIVVDLSRLEFADSTTLHVLLEARALSDLWLVGPLHPQVRLLFQVTDLLDAFHFTDGLEEAIGTLDRAV